MFELFWFYAWIAWSVATAVITWPMLYRGDRRELEKWGFLILINFLMLLGTSLLATFYIGFSAGQLK